MRIDSQKCHFSDILDEPERFILLIQLFSIDLQHPGDCLSHLHVCLWALYMCGKELGFIIFPGNECVALESGTIFKLLCQDIAFLVLETMGAGKCQVLDVGA